MSYVNILIFCSCIVAVSAFPPSLVIEEASYAASPEFRDVDVDKDVHFLLWTRENPYKEYEIIHDDLFSISNSNFKASRPTKILVHGYTDNGKVGWIRSVRDKYLDQGDYNVISVDWENLAGPGPLYFYAAENTKPTGYRIGDFIEFVINTTGAELKDFHAVGFSLGGQVVGHLGFRTGGKMSRITGLDPAGPLFHTVAASDRLSKEDAAFVDVIHTAGLWIGTDEVVGHVDFYPNGGMAPQPGCEDDDLGLGYSHARAPQLFAESIPETGFKSVICGSWEDFQAELCDDGETNLMGEPADPLKPGVYFLATNAQSPYAISR